MHKASWVLLLAVSLMLTAGCKKDELRAKDARIAELMEQGQATGTSLEQCKKDRENLNKLVKGYTGEINAMEAALAEAAAPRGARCQPSRRVQFDAQATEVDDRLRQAQRSYRPQQDGHRASRGGSLRERQREAQTEGVRVLAALGPVLASIKGRKFQVGGHTDNKPIRTARFPSNWELSGARAIDVAELLISTAFLATESRPPRTPTPSPWSRTTLRKAEQRTVASRSRCSRTSTSFPTSRASSKD